ncbi:MAG: beta-galactosidase trimerization domain-containing protein, partial [Monoglobaceae bacterium]
AQVEEVCKKYDADGIFLDIASIHPCYCNTCIAEREALGMDPYDEKNVLKHAEMVYARYAKRMREAVDKYKPGLPLFHNGGHIWGGRRDLAHYNSHLELESLPTGGWGYDHFPMSARYVQNLNMEYLGMTGKFHTSWGEFGGFKHPNALRYEAALCAAHGAKCSVGDQLAPSGKMDMTTYKLIGAAYKELEEKEPWLDNVKPVCDVALLTCEAVLNESGENAGRNMDSDVGANRILIEGKYQYSIIDCEEDFGKYKVIILPDRIKMTDALAEKLMKFVRSGGKILASGKSGISEGKFLFDFGVKYEGECEYTPSYIRPVFDNEYESDFIMYELAQKAELCGGEELAQLTEPYFNRTREHFCSHQHAPSSGRRGGCGMAQGRDGIYIAWNIFDDYAKKGELIAKRAVCHALDLLLGDDKCLKTNLGAQGVATLMRQNERYVAHLLYAVPTKRGKDIEVIEDICPVHNISLSVKLPKKINRAYLVPQMKDIELIESDGRYEVLVDTVNCHQVVIFE